MHIEGKTTWKTEKERYRRKALRQILGKYDDGK
jgi:hypothetical protein